QVAAYRLRSTRLCCRPRANRFRPKSVPWTWEIWASVCNLAMQICNGLAGLQCDGEPGSLAHRACRPQAGPGTASVSRVRDPMEMGAAQISSRLRLRHRVV